MPPCCLNQLCMPSSQLDSEFPNEKRPKHSFQDVEDISKVPAGWLQLAPPDCYHHGPSTSVIRNVMASLPISNLISIADVPNMESLSEKCLQRIFDFLLPADKISFSLSCKRVCSVASQTVNQLKFNATVRDIPLERILQKFRAAKVVDLSLQEDDGWLLTTEKIKILCQSNLPLLALTLDKQPAVTDTILAMIGESFPTLKILSLNACLNVGTDGIVAVAQVCLQIQSLHISYCRNVTSKALEELNYRCQMLETLEMSDVSRFSGIWSKLKHLTVTCDANECKIAGGMATECPSLESLKLCFCCGIDKLDFIDRHSRSIKALILESCTGVSPAMFQKEWPTLEALFIQSSDVTDATLHGISKTCMKLTALTLQSCGDISNAGLSELVLQCSGLKNLDVSQSPHITQCGVVEFANGKGLSLLRIVLPRHCFGRKHLRSVARHGWQLDSNSKRLLLSRRTPCSCFTCHAKGKGNHS